MGQENTYGQKNKFVPPWVKSTQLWKLLSKLKLAFKRMSMTAPYWRKSRFLQMFRYYMVVESINPRGDFQHPFDFKGIQFNLRPMEWHLMKAILLDEEYGKVAELFEKRPPTVVVDAGANVGMFSVYALAAWPSTKIYAVEPSPETFKILEQNQRKNPSLDWHALQYAFWESDGTISFEDQGMSMAAHISTNVDGIQVPAIRFDHFMDQYLRKDERVSILKMDIEGAEEAVLRASQAALSRVDVMVIEIHTGICNEAVVRDILKREFAFVYDLSAPSTQYPVVLACRGAVAGMDMM